MAIDGLQIHRSTNHRILGLRDHSREQRWIRGKSSTQSHPFGRMHMNLPPSAGPAPALIRHGRPKGSLDVSRLDGKEAEIRRFLGLGVSKTAIAKCGRVPYHPLQLMSTRGLRLSR